MTGRSCDRHDRRVGQPEVEIGVRLVDRDSFREQGRSDRGSRVGACRQRGEEETRLLVADLLSTEVVDLDDDRIGNDEVPTAHIDEHGGEAMSFILAVHRGQQRPGVNDDGHS